MSVCLKKYADNKHLKNTEQHRRYNHPSDTFPSRYPIHGVPFLSQASSIAPGRDCGGTRRGYRPSGAAGNRLSVFKYCIFMGQIW